MFVLGHHELLLLTILYTKQKKPLRKKQQDALQDHPQAELLFFSPLRTSTAA